MHSMFGRATLSQLAFPREGNLNFPWEKSHWDNTVVKKKDVLDDMSVLMSQAYIQMENWRYLMVRKHFLLHFITDDSME